MRLEEGLAAVLLLLFLGAQDVGRALIAGKQVLAVVGVEELAESLDAARDHQEIVGAGAPSPRMRREGLGEGLIVDGRSLAPPLIRPLRGHLLPALRGEGRGRAHRGVDEIVPCALVAQIDF